MTIGLYALCLISAGLSCWNLMLIAKLTRTVDLHAVTITHLYGRLKKQEIR